MLNKFYSDKLFYNKYAYKLEFFSCIGHLARQKKLSTLKSFIDCYNNNYSIFINIKDNDHSAYQWDNDNDDIPYVVKWAIRRFQPTANDVKNASLLYNFLTNNQDVKIRVEMNSIGLYSNNLEILEELGNNLQDPYPCKIYVPRDVQMKANTVYHNYAAKYKYKVTIGRADPSLGDYLENNNNIFVKAGATCIDAVKKQLTGSYNSYYFYVRDDKILNIISMFGFEAKRIEELLLK